MLGSELLNWNGNTLHLFLVIGSFFLGSAISGTIIASSTLKLGRRYGVALLIEGILLFISGYLLTRNLVAGQYFASVACGLQNALATTFSGAVVRTTHVTGIITDLGIMIGEWMRGISFDRRKAKLFLFILSGFLCGSFIGTWLFAHLSVAAIYAPATLSIAIAISYWLFLASKKTNKGI